MPALKNPRHEVFAQALASGKPKRQAAISAGFPDSSAHVRGCELAKMGNIRDRVKEIQRRTVSGNIKTAIEIKEWLSKLIDTSITDIYRITEDEMYLQNGEIPAELAPFIEEIRVEQWTGGKGHRAESRRTVVKLYNKLKAIEILNAMADGGTIPAALQTLMEQIRDRRLKAGVVVELSEPSEVT